MFSLVLTVYRQSHLSEIEACLLSVTNQSIPPSEIVVVVDGPVSEDLLFGLKRFFENFSFAVHLIELPVNVGPGTARNEGAKICNYDLIAIMDSDDICSETRFEKQLSFLKENPDVDVVGGQIFEFKSENEFTSKNLNIKPSRAIVTKHADIYARRHEYIPCNNVTVMFRKSKFLEAGGYPALRFGEDLVLWHTMLANGAVFANLPDVLVYVRISQDFVLRRTGIKIFIGEFKYLNLLYRRGLIGIGLYSRRMLLSMFVRFVPPSVYVLLRKVKNR